MKVLITGGGGQLATALKAGAPGDWDLSTPTREELDITRASQVRALFEKFQPGLVINTAAYTAVDKAEAEPEAAFAINAEGARIVAEAALETGTRMIQLSTDFVFDGRKSHPYEEEDTPHPINAYGHSKREGERLVLGTLGDQGCVVRTAWLYGADGSNFVTGMLGRMQDGQDLKVVADQVGTPTWTRTLASALWQLARRPDMDGIQHFTDAGVASWYDFAVAIQEEALSLGRLGKAVAITPICTEDYDTQAMRPYFSVLDKSETWAELGIEPLHWRAALRGMLEAL